MSAITLFSSSMLTKSLTKRFMRKVLCVKYADPLLYRVHDDNSFSILLLLSYTQQKKLFFTRKERDKNEMENRTGGCSSFQCVFCHNTPLYVAIFKVERIHF